MTLQMLDKVERQRVREILAILASHGFKNGFSKIKNPVNLRQTIEALGPSFIKIGQILSMRPDLLSDEYINEFQKLQDNVPPVPFETIHEMLGRAYGRPTNEIFSSISETPLACASIAVVHRATLVNGDEVVLKIMRPRARESITADLAILRKVAPFLKLLPPSEVLSPEELAEELSSAVLNELDFRNEAENMRRFYEFNEKEDDIKVPKVYKEFSGDTVIVMEYLDGISLRETVKLAEMGYDMEQLVTAMAHNFLKQIFEDGFFHADPHSGNILVVDDRIAYVDFGLVASMRPGLRKKLRNLVYAVATKDVDNLAFILYSIANKKGDVDFREFNLDVELIYRRYITDSLGDIDAREFLVQAIAVARKHRLATPREVILLLKVVGTTDGIIREYIPKLDPIEVFMPYFKKKFFANFSQRNDTEDQITSLVTLLRTSTKIPQKFHELMTTAAGGRLRINVEHVDITEILQGLRMMGNRLGASLIVAALIIGASIVASSDAAAIDHKTLAFSGYAIAALVVLLLWWLQKRARD